MGRRLYWLLQESTQEYSTDPVVKFGFGRGLEPVNYVTHILDRFNRYKQFVASYYATQPEGLLEVFDTRHHFSSRRRTTERRIHIKPTRLRERLMRRFKSAAQAQRFLFALGIITSHFRPGRHLCTAAVYREMMTRRFPAWKEVVVTQANR